jgi:hypothetical protein
VTYLNAIAALCAGSAWLVSRRAPQHRPVAVALSICAALDIARAALPLPPRVDLALCLGAASFWAYPIAMRAPVPTWCVEAWTEAAGAMWTATVLLMLLYPEAWDWWLPSLYGVAIVAGFLSGLARWFDGDGWTVTQRTAAMLLAGDAAGLVLLCRREWISYQAGAVLAVVTCYQVWWLWRLRYGNSERIKG